MSQIISQWYHLTLPDTIAPPPSPQCPTDPKWTCLLNFARKQEGCKGLSWARMIEDPSKAWLVIEWASVGYLEAFEQTTDHKAFWIHLLALTRHQPVVQHIKSPLGRFIVGADPDADPMPCYLIGTFYFPFDLSPGAMEHIDKMFSLDLSDDWVREVVMHGDRGRVKEGVDSDNDGWFKKEVMHWARGWVEEVVAWQGQAMRAWVYVFMFRGEERVRKYMEEREGKIREKRERKYTQSVNTPMPREEFPPNVLRYSRELERLGKLGSGMTRGHFIAFEG